MSDELSPYLLAVILTGLLSLAALAAFVKHALYALLAPGERKPGLKVLNMIGFWEVFAAGIALSLAFLWPRTAFLPGSAYFLVAFYPNLRAANRLLQQAQEGGLSSKAYVRGFALSAVFPTLCLFALLVLQVVWPVP